jgi:hypothetical protein
VFVDCPSGYRTGWVCHCEIEHGRSDKCPPLPVCNGKYVLNVNNGCASWCKYEHPQNYAGTGDHPEDDVTNPVQGDQWINLSTGCSYVYDNDIWKMVQKKYTSDKKYMLCSEDCYMISEGINDTDPMLVTTVFEQELRGDSTNESVLRYNYDGTNKTVLANFNEVGPIHGLSYRPRTDDLFCSVFYKRHSRMRQDGLTRDSLGTIYRINGVRDVSNKAITEFIDLDAYNASFSPGLDNHDYPNMSSDMDAFNMFGKKGLGDMDMNDEHVFVVNLFDRNVYRIPYLIGDTVTDYVPSDTRVVDQLDMVTMIVQNPPYPLENNDNLRPFALKCHKGRVYVGFVNTEELLSNGLPHPDRDSALTAKDNMYACVYSIDAVTYDISSLKLESAFKLNYAKNPNIIAGSNGDIPIQPISNVHPLAGNVNHFWVPWTNNVDVYYTNDTETLVNWPTPILTDIEFVSTDTGDCMILGFRDRTGDQLTDNNEPLNLIQVDTSGDVIKATYNEQSELYEVELPQLPVNPTTPVDADSLKFFTGDYTRFDDSGFDYENHEISSGSLAYSEKNKTIICTAINPGTDHTIEPTTGDDLQTGGIIGLSMEGADVGEKNNSFVVHNEKCRYTGMGDVEILPVYAKFCIKLFEQIMVRDNVLTIHPEIIATDPINQDIVNTLTYTLTQVNIDLTETIKAEDVPFNVSSDIGIDLDFAYKFILSVTGKPECSITIERTDIC